MAIHLSDIENSIIRDGMKGAKFALSILDEQSLKYQNLKTVMSDLHTIYSKLGTGFVNRATSMDTYSGQLKEWLNSDITIKAMKANISELEKKLNKSVISAQREDTKRKRLLLKNTIISFWISNISNVIYLLQFRNKIIEAKTIIESNQ